MSYTTIEAVKDATDCYIRDRLNEVRVELVNYLQSTLYYVDPSIRKEASIYLYKRQLFVLATRNDFDIDEVIAAVHADAENCSETRSEENVETDNVITDIESNSKYNITDKIETDSKEDMDTEANTVTEIKEDMDAEANTITEIKEDMNTEANTVTEIKEDIKVSVISDVRDDSKDITEMNETVDVSTVSSKYNIKPKNKDKKVIVPACLVEKVKTVDNVAEQLVSNIQVIKDETEEKFTFVCRNKTYLEAIMKHAELSSSSSNGVSIIKSVEQLVSHPVIQPQQSVEQSSSWKRCMSRPLNPTVFRTKSGNRIEVPILDPAHIIPFTNLFANMFNIDPSFNSYRTPYANTRLKAAYEAMKYLDVDQDLINSLLNQLTSIDYSK